MACNDRECSVCYSETGPFQMLTCGHSFCNGCIKQWYLKGTGTGCPMCRRPIYFKGFHKLRDQWNEDAWETKCADIFSEAIDSAVTDALDMAQYFSKKYYNEILSEAMTSIKEIESTFRYLKSEGIDTDDIEYVLFDTDEYYSDRHLDKFYYIDEPRKEPALKYPANAAGMAPPGGGKRCRAREDPWSSMTLYFEI